MSEPVMCPHCDGKRFVVAFVDYSDGSGGLKQMACRTCAGVGNIEPEQAEQIEAGRVIRKARIARLETLHDAAQRWGFTPAELSAIERGLMPLKEGMLQEATQ